MPQSSFLSDGSLFLSFWASRHPNAEPMGWKLRETATPWARFHALPQSKRYAESDIDRAIVLSRANALGSALLNAGAPCWIVEARADDIEGDGEFFGSYREEQDAPTWRYYVREGIWENGKFDTEIAQIADDGPAYIIWISLKTGSIFAPYDGGFDLFPSSENGVEQLRKEYADWLSDRDDGL